MIGKVLFASVYSNPYRYQKCCPKPQQSVQNQYQSNPSFGGVLDNPESKKVITDANGNTYIIEQGAVLVQQPEQSGNKGGNAGTAVASGAGGAAIGSGLVKPDSAKAQNAQDIKTHEVQQDDEPEETSEDVTNDDSSETEQVSTDDYSYEEDDDDDENDEDDMDY